MIFTITLHYYIYPTKERVDKLVTLTELTHYSKLSLSVAYDETLYNSTYPDMPTLKKMDFVYE